MPYTQLTVSCRETIARLRSQGLGNNEIARQMGRDKSTLSREIARNAKANGRYEARHAQNKLRARRQAAAKPRRKLARDARLRQKVEHRLVNRKTRQDQACTSSGSAPPRSRRPTPTRRLRSRYHPRAHCGFARDHQ